MPTLGEVTKEAVRTGDARKAGKVADVLRFGHGFRYDDVLAFFRRITGITPADFEALMYEADVAESEAPPSRVALGGCYTTVQPQGATED